MATNVGSMAVSSSLTICESSINTRHASRLVQQTYSLVLSFYESIALFDGAFIITGLEALIRVVKYANALNIPEYRLTNEPVFVIRRLLKKGKAEEALILFHGLFNEYSKNDQTLLFYISVIFETMQENRGFARKVVKAVKDNFKSVGVEVKIEKDKSGRSFGVRDNKVEIEIGDEDKKLARWIKKSLEK